jgi:hypothetical protein
VTLDDVRRDPQSAQEARLKSPPLSHSAAVAIPADAA